MNEGFKQFFSASEKDRVDTFLAASQRLGANVQYIEKDFWVCWTLDVLYHGRHMFCPSATRSFSKLLPTSNESGTIGSPSCTRKLRWKCTACIF